MSSPYAALAALVVLLLGAGYHLGWHQSLAASLPPLESLGTGEESEPVLILLLGSTESVEHLRAVVAPERVIADGRSAFALAGGRIVAADVESASDPLNAAGWTERPVQILTAARLAQGQAQAEPGNALAELARKPTLTPGEALRLLRQLD